MPRKRKIGPHAFPFLFVLVIVALFIGALAFLVQFEPKPPSTPEITTLQYVNACLGESLSYAIRTVAEQGGYATLPVRSHAGRGAPYYGFVGDVQFPAEAEVLQAVTEITTARLPRCLDYAAIKPVAIESVGAPVVTVQWQERNVLALLTMPLEGRSGRKTFTLKQFGIALPARLAVLYNAAQTFMDIQQQDPKALCITCLQRIAEERGLDIETTNLAEDEVHFLFTDTVFPVQGQPVEWQFIIRYP